MSTYTENSALAVARKKSSGIRHFFEIGGFIAGAILVAFGVVAIVMGFNGRSTVSDSLKQENIVGSADMTPALIVEGSKGSRIDRGGRAEHVCRRQGDQQR